MNVEGQSGMRPSLGGSALLQEVKIGYPLPTQVTKQNGRLEEHCSHRVVSQGKDK